MHRVMLLIVLALPSTGWAEETQRAEVELEGPVPVRNYINLRVGASTQNANGRPALCIEGSPLAWLSVEACGTGAGILHNSREPEVAHFRAKLRATKWSLGDFQLDLLFGAGVAELQIDRDAPGLRFSDAGPQGVETAGPEVSSHLRVLLPVWAGVDALFDLGLGAAYFPNADQLVVPSARFQPFFEASIGAGF